MSGKWKYINKLNKNSESISLSAKRSWSGKMLMSGLFFHCNVSFLVIPIIHCETVFVFFHREQITGSIAISVNFNILTDQYANINVKYIGLDTRS